MPAKQRGAGGSPRYRGQPDHKEQSDATGLKKWLRRARLVAASRGPKTCAAAILIPVILATFATTNMWQQQKNASLQVYRNASELSKDHLKAEKKDVDSLGVERVVENPSPTQRKQKPPKSWSSRLYKYISKLFFGASPPSVGKRERTRPRNTDRWDLAGNCTENCIFVPMPPGVYDTQFVKEHGADLGYPTKVWESPLWPLKKDPKWQVPQNICPGRASRKKHTDGAPSRESTRKILQKMIELHVDGKYMMKMQNGTRKMVENPCLFLTKDCARLDVRSGGPQAMKTLRLDEVRFEEMRQDGTFIDLKPGSLGSCALVANSQNLIKGRRGADIDGHDTIFRHNTPIKGYERAVGRVPSSVIWTRRDYSTRSPAQLMYDMLVPIDKLPKNLTYRGRPLMIVNKLGPAGWFGRYRSSMYSMAGLRGNKHPSGGFARPFSLLASGLCTRVDIYGFSSRPTGKYFDKKATVMKNHVMPFEHWVFRHLQRLGRLCVYGD